jgi:hypothetical protein
MPSLIEDFAFIAKRAQEIRVARYQELGVSAPNPPAAPQTVPQQTVSPQAVTEGFRYAPGFEHLAALSNDAAGGSGVGRVSDVAATAGHSDYRSVSRSSMRRFFA